jgi:hypothetical protein
MDISLSFLTIMESLMFPTDERDRDGPVPSRERRQQPC